MKKTMVKILCKISKFVQFISNIFTIVIAINQLLK